MDRKLLKKNARKTLKKHYWLLTFVCAAVMVAGVEFTGSRSLLDSVDQNKAEETTQLAVPGSGNSASRVFIHLVEQRYEQAQETADEAMKEEMEKATSFLGRTRGVLAQAVNTMLSGKLSVQIAQALYGIFQSESIVSILLIGGAIAYYMLVWFFFLNLASIIMRRLFLEARMYERVPLIHGMYFRTVKRWTRTACTVFLEKLYLALWSLTIIGGFVKYFSYYLVDFIAAENPDIMPNEAICLSRRIMNDHKWEAFKLELSMLGWRVLSVLTGGFAGILWCNAYETGVKSEYYAYMRFLAKESGISGAEKLNDTWLFEKADRALIEQTYSDIEEQEEYLEKHDLPLSAKQRFWVENFSVWPGRIDEKRAYQNLMSRKYQVDKDKEVLEGRQYPMRMNSLWTLRIKNLGGDVFFMRTYTVWSLVLLFFGLSMFGWFWEVLLTLLERGIFVNRGTMYGPWLPIYGFGGVLCLVLLTRLRKNPPAAFAGSVLLCGFLEYMASWILELAYGNVWWSYNGYFLNLNGRICAEGLLVFGIGCSAVIYLLGPVADTVISRIPKKKAVTAGIVLLMLFGVDRVISTFTPNAGEGITDDDTLNTPAEADADDEFLSIVQ